MYILIQVCVDRIQSLRTTIAEIQSCKPGLCLPEKAEETLTVFQRVDQLQQQLEELEKVAGQINDSSLHTNTLSQMYTQDECFPLFSFIFRWFQGSS